jgi:hypothetical protein
MLLSLISRFASQFSKGERCYTDEGSGFHAHLCRTFQKSPEHDRNGKLPKIIRDFGQKFENDANLKLSRRKICND